MINHDAYQAIGEEGGVEALSMVASFMEFNERCADTLNQQILEWAESDRDKWKARALEAEANLKRIESRIWGLLS